jgi:hypothetical protein
MERLLSLVDPGPRSGQTTSEVGGVRLPMPFRRCKGRSPLQELVGNHGDDLPQKIRAETGH